MRRAQNVAVWLALAVALALPARLVHDVSVAVLDDRCFESARVDAKSRGLEWPDSQARARCHMAGDKLLYSNRIWSEDPLGVQMFAGSGFAAVVFAEEGLYWVLACLPLAVALVARRFHRRRRNPPEVGA